jgi:nitrogen regulatory protein P-II 1
VLPVRRIEAIIKPSRLEEVKRALGAMRAAEVTVSEVKGFAREAGHTDSPGGDACVVEFLPRVKLDVVVDDELVPKVVSTIQRAAKTGGGDGWMIFVLAASEHFRAQCSDPPAGPLPF